MVCLEIRDTPSCFDIAGGVAVGKRRYCRKHVAMSLCRLPHVATEHTGLPLLFVKSTATEHKE